MTRLEWIRSRANWIGRECLRGPFRGDWYHSVHLPSGEWSKAHRLMCEAAHGAPERESAMALHSCGNKWCVNPQHLRWGTCRENAEDAGADGVLKRGEESVKAKLTAEDVLSARRDRRSGMSYRQLARKYGIAKGAIWHAVNGTQWRYVK